MIKCFPIKPSLNSQDFPLKWKVGLNLEVKPSRFFAVTTILRGNLNREPLDSPHQSRSHMPRRLSTNGQDFFWLYSELRHYHATSSHGKAATTCVPIRRYIMSKTVHPTRFFLAIIKVLSLQKRGLTLKQATLRSRQAEKAQPSCRCERRRERHGTFPARALGSACSHDRHLGLRENFTPIAAFLTEIRPKNQLESGADR